MSKPGEAVGLATGILLAVSLILALTLVFFVCLNPIAVTDFWWQAKTGELIVRTGSIPHQDPFSWTAAGQPWLVHEWLTEVFFYAGLAFLPHWVLVAYKGGLAVLACALVLVRAWRRSESITLGIFAAIAAALVMRNFADLRPQMVTFVLLAGLLLALDEYRDGRLKRLPWALPAMFTLWANLHGGVVVGLLLIACWAAGECIGQWLLRERSERLGPLGLGLALSCLSVALNPNGFHVYTYPAHVLGHPEVMDYITEWWAPNFHRAGMRPFEILLLATLASLALSRDRRRVGEVLVLAAMAHAALFSQRNTVPFALAAAPAVAGAVGALWREAAPLQAMREAHAHPIVRAAGAAALAAILLVLVLVHRPPVPPHQWFDYTIAHEHFPRAAADQMERGRWPGRMYNDYVWGGYLIWRLHPRRQVFIDGRAEVYYSTRTFDDEMTIHQLRTGWQDVLKRRDVETVLTSKTGALAAALAESAAWRLDFTGPVEVVYIRR